MKSTRKAIYTRFAMHRTESCTAKEGRKIHHKPEGSAMTVEFELEGQAFVALNGGPLFKFNEGKYGVSRQITCHHMAEYISGSDPIKSQRAVKAMLRKKKIGIEGIHK
jgi:predicted 3-demethylubiquinone-9 3-methyltransferase (glyoxalase superfamily)